MAFCKSFNCNKVYMPVKYLLLIFCVFSGFLGNTKKIGQDIIDSMVQQLPYSKEDTLKVKMLNAISYKYNSVMPEKGINYGKQGLELSDKLGWKKGKALAYNTIATNYENQSNHTIAIENFEKAINIYEELGNKEGIGINKEYIANVLLAECDFPNALSNYIDVLRINEELKDNYNIARNYANIANVYQAIGDYAKALLYGQKSFSIHKKYEDKNALAIEHINIANAYNSQTKYDSAMENGQSALNNFKETGDNLGISTALCNIGEIYKNQKNYQKALENYFESEKIAVNAGYKLNSSNILGNIGETYLLIALDTSSKIQLGTLVPEGKKANLLKAIEFLKRGLSGCKEISDYLGVIEFSKYLSDAYKLSGDNAEALGYYKIYADNKDSVYSIAKLKAIANLESSLSIETTNKQILLEKLYLLKKDNKIIVLTIGVALLLIINIIVLKNSYKHKRDNELLQEEIKKLSS